MIGGLLVPWLRRAGTTRNTCFQGTTLSLGLTRIHIPAVRRNSSQPSLRCSVFNATLQPPRIRRSTPIHRLPCSNFLHLGLQVSLLTQRVIAVAFAPPSNLRLQVTPLTRRTDFITILRVASSRIPNSYLTGTGIRSPDPLLRKPRR